MENIKKISFGFVSLLMIVGGLQILFGGFLESSSASQSVYQFTGAERVVGIMPVLIGGLFLYFIIKKQD